MRTTTFAEYACPGGTLRVRRIGVALDAPPADAPGGAMVGPFPFVPGK